MSATPFVPPLVTSQCQRRRLTRPSLAQQLHNLLVRSGAEPCPPSEQRGGQNGSEQQSDPADRRLPRFDPQRLTHLITDSLDFLEYDLVQRVNGRDPNSDRKGKGKARETPSETSIEAAEDRIHVVTVNCPACCAR